MLIKATVLFLYISLKSWTKQKSLIRTSFTLLCWSPYKCISMYSSLPFHSIPKGEVHIALLISSLLSQIYIMFKLSWDFPPLLIPSFSVLQYSSLSRRLFLYPITRIIPFPIKKQTKGWRKDFPGSLVVKTQCRGCGSHPWVGNWGPACCQFWSRSRNRNKQTGR